MEEEDINESIENKNLLEGKHGPRDLKKNARYYLNSFKVPKTGGGNEKKKTLWYYDAVLDHIIGRDLPFLHGVAAKSPREKNETSGDCIDTLNEKCKRQKSEENHNQVNYVHQSQVLHDVDAENGQPAQLQKTDV
ncbi:hypothetical protein DPMN_187835 [Dreissena polymorpha]|uniref:Uncharacterized protein n=1 Tax=Dreissena polymorpha TaxID=45954 RepID=A0A9D4DPS9_DREPO|nr:hypothetical protein DPMN_187835 [Dreissena polymorpha]